MKNVIKTFIVILLFNFNSCLDEGKNKVIIEKHFEKVSSDSLLKLFVKAFPQKKIIDYIEGTEYFNMLEKENKVKPLISPFKIRIFSQNHSHGNHLLSFSDGNAYFLAFVPGRYFDEFTYEDDSIYFQKDSLLPTFLFNCYSNMLKHKLSPISIQNELIKVIRLIHNVNLGRVGDYTFKNLTDNEFKLLINNEKFHFTNSEKEKLIDCYNFEQFKIIVQNETKLFIYLENPSKTNFISYVFTLH